MAAQIVVTACMLGVFGVAPISFDYSVTTGRVTSKTGDVITVARNNTPNFFIGPQNNVLVLLGAKFAPCMRPDSEQRTQIRNQQVASDRGLGAAPAPR